VPSGAEETNFKAVQAINLARLQSFQRYIPSNTELSTLINITYSTSPSAVYARSLYYILTGQELNITLPDLPDGSGPRSERRLP
jgi:hypothetical protein